MIILSVRESASICISIKSIRIWSLFFSLWFEIVVKISAIFRNMRGIVPSMQCYNFTLKHITLQRLKYLRLSFFNFCNFIKSQFLICTLYHIFGGRNHIFDSQVHTSLSSVLINLFKDDFIKLYISLGENMTSTLQDFFVYFDLHDLSPWPHLGLVCFWLSNFKLSWNWQVKMPGDKDPDLMSLRCEGISGGKNMSFCRFTWWWPDSSIDRALDERFRGPVFKSSSGPLHFFLPCYKYIEPLSSFLTFHPVFAQGNFELLVFKLGPYHFTQDMYLYGNILKMLLLVTSHVWYQSCLWPHNMLYQNYWAKITYKLKIFIQGP